MLAQSPTRASPPAAGSTDLLRWPLVGTLLRWRHLRTTAQITLGLVAVVIVLHGWLGPQLAPKNLASVLTWIHYRGLLIGALLAAGNLFCGGCPMVLVRDLGRRLRRPTLRWPRRLGPKWIGLALFAAVLFAYERFDLWALPAATAWLIVGYFVAALVVDLTFTGAAFCRHVCPVGQFNFIASTLSPLELRVRERSTCNTCRTADCIKGRRAPTAGAVGRDAPVPLAGAAPALDTSVASTSAASASAASTSAGSASTASAFTIVQRGCELNLFLPTKTGNLDCTFCLDCVQACPHDNVALGFRVPGDELADDRRRSSIGRLSKRPDLAALALLFTFGALLNAFAMTGPAYAMEQGIARLLGTTSETLVVGLVFVAGLGLVPLGLCAGAAVLVRRLVPTSPHGIRDTIVRYAYALVPLGFGVWLAHYGFHLLTAAGTIVPVAQSAAMDVAGALAAGLGGNLAGAAPLGEPDWRWLGLRPGVVFPLQLGVVMLGMMGTLMLVQRISERDHPAFARRAAAPWALLVVALTVLVLWILAQPMDMRGTVLAG